MTARAFFVRRLRVGSRDVYQVARRGDRRSRSFGEFLERAAAKRETDMLNRVALAEEESRRGRNRSLDEVTARLGLR